MTSPPECVASRCCDVADGAGLDIAVDQFDRVWARGPGSLTLISQ
jgi:hypothetical protein